MLTAVLGKVNYWHSTREIIWKIGFLQDRVKKFRLYLLNQCISEENQGWLQNDRELKILEKMRYCLWKFELWFWTYGWIRLIDPSAPYIFSRLQTPRSRIILRFHNFIGFISWFLRKWGPVCENCNYSSGLMAGYVFLAQVTQM